MLVIGIWSGPQALRRNAIRCNFCDIRADLPNLQLELYSVNFLELQTVLEKLPARSSTMRAFTSLLSARCLLVLSAFKHIGAFAGPGINVALRASFNSAPYLVELL